VSDEDPRTSPFEGVTDRREFIKRAAVAGASASAAGSLIEAVPALARAKARRPAVRQKTAIVAAVNTPPTLDWEYMAGTPASWEIAINMYDRKLSYPIVNKKTGKRDFSKIEPRLIERMEPLGDGQTWLVHVRRGVKNNLGDTMTASDLKWAWERAIGLKSIGLFYAKLMNLRNVHQLDKYTLRYRLYAYSGLVLASQTSPWVPFHDVRATSPHATTDDPWAKTWLSTNGVGYGPYYLDQLTAGQQVILRANPNFWQGKPDIDTVIYNAIPEAANRLAVLKNGDANIAINLSADQLAQVASDPKLTVSSFTGNNAIGVFMNVQSPPLDNPKVRQALAYASPYQQVLTDIYKGQATPIKSYIPPMFPGYTSKYYPYTTDYDKAKSILNAAGVKTPFDLTLTYAQFKPETELVAIALRESFAKIGVNLTLQLVTPAKFSQISASRQGQLLLASALRIGVMDALFGFEVFAGQLPRGILNYGNYANKQVLALLAKGRDAKDQPTRLKIIDQIQKEMAADPPWLMLGVEKWTVAHAKNIAGFSWTLQQSIDFNTLTMT
jgi:peptide/nickel transport system substrate-binding protein